MGLPIWRDPQEKAVKKEKDTIKPDPTAVARSPIRRRPSIHGRSRNRNRVTYDTSRPIPRFERSPPPSIGFNGSREGRRRADHPRVPPISTLLESADRRSAVPPPPTPPAPETRSLEMQALDARERELRTSLAELHDRAARLDQEARAIESGLRQELPDDFMEWPDQERQAWIRDNLIHTDSPDGLAEQDLAQEVSGATTQQMPFSRSPEPMSQPNRPESRDGTAARRSALPTPPHDVSEDPESLFVPVSNESRAPNRRPMHPLSRSWRPESPINGLGDRNRSPTPADAWEMMQSTIAPDANLPSADSSFTSAAASHSFTSNETQITEPDRDSSVEQSRRNSADDGQSDSGLSVDPTDLVCNDEDLDEQAVFAEDVYFYERGTSEGRERITRQEEAHAREGNRYALSVESEWAEIGFRLIADALTNPEGRERLFQYTQSRPDNARNLEDWIFASRGQQRRTRGAHITDSEPPSPHPERYSAATRAAVRESASQVHDYFNRFTADALAGSDSRSRDRITSPPPRYEPLASHPDVNTFTSRDPPEAHPVSPPSTRSERDVGDALLSGSGDEQDLDSMRRIVERLAQREDVPDEWWMSMGLNLSRTRARSRSLTRRSPRSSDSGRVRSGRVERSNSRL